jgi:glycosyltransferase involved in cell wall biosynthesis
LGHQVDLVTYPMGEDVPVPGLRYLRARVPGIKTVAVGLSWRKVPLNLAVFAKAGWALVVHRRRYQVLHTHEEAGILGPLARAVGVPHVYDMGNELAVVARNYGLGDRHLITRLAAWAERRIVRSADVVIAHFPAIKNSVSAWAPSVPVEVVFNIPLDPGPDPRLTSSFRSQWSPDGRPVVLYTGTLERYQGLEELVDAMADPAVWEAKPRLVVVGGTQKQVEALRSRAGSRGLSASVIFTGTIPQDHVCSALGAADILVSPRSSGTNTPLKLFSYLKSGRPILATRIASHTQVIDERAALLVDPGAKRLAYGLAQLLADDVLRRRLAANALELAGTYSPAAFVGGVGRAYAHLGASTGGVTAEDVTAGGVAAGPGVLVRAAAGGVAAGGVAASGVTASGVTAGPGVLVRAAASGVTASGVTAEDVTAGPGVLVRAAAGGGR